MFLYSGCNQSIFSIPYSAECLMKDSAIDPQDFASLITAAMNSECMRVSSLYSVSNTLCFISSSPSSESSFFASCIALPITIVTTAICLGLRVSRTSSTVSPSSSSSSEESACSITSSSDPSYSSLTSSLSSDSSPASSSSYSSSTLSSSLSSSECISSKGRPV